MRTRRFEAIKIVCTVTIITSLACSVLLAYGASEEKPHSRKEWKLNVDCQFYEPPSTAITVNGTSADGEVSPTCSPTLILDLPLPRSYLAFRDSVIDGATEFYAYHGQSIMWQYHIDSLLNVSYDTVPIFGGPWVAADLDLDGEVEVVTQYGDRLQIFSAPDWRFRKGFIFPGLNVVMYATAVNVDTDPYMEIFLTPNGLSGYSIAVVIDYDPLLNSFRVLANIPAPIGTVGRQAIGDFDTDGRMEFIVGNDFGYGLFEWFDSSLVYVGSVGSVSVYEMNSFTASSVRPGPCGELMALLGYSSPVVYEHHYELLRATGDNIFEPVHVFAETTGWTGIQPNIGVDTDCDGLDELSMGFPPYQETWDWDNGTSNFVRRCEDVGEGPGAISELYPVDFDRNGASELLCMTSGGDFHVWSEGPCGGCDSVGACSPTPLCGCEDHGDPSNDGVRADVVDVVLSIGVAFRAQESIMDDASCCPSVTTDLDCNGQTDVIDVVKMIDIAFRNGYAQVITCHPCQ